MLEKQDIFTLMGGAVRMWRGGYNPTCDAVLLAAFAGACRAKTILDVGVGSGGVALCIMQHIAGARITGIDNSAQMLDQCARNAELNNCDIELINADIFSWRTAQTFDLVVTNPPYFRGTPSIKHGHAHQNADIQNWIRRSIARVRPHGTFCTIIDAAVAAECIAVINEHCGGIYIMPLFGARDTAERVLIRGCVGSRGNTIIHSGISMNCDAVLRDGLTIADALSKLNA
ncbi:MAG: methyltransferase [Alphaproteobacteria bacterium]|nr:methyltransferase [Alphaproteobacteria bacterium]